MIGTVGEVCLLDKTPDFAIKNVGLFKCKNEVKSRWLFYFLKSKMGKNYILSRLSGTTQKYITLGELRKFPIPSPLIEEQKAIAQILTAFDDKIELLQTQNKTLETTAQTIFKEWFGKYQIGDELPEGWRVGKYGKLANHLKESVKPFEHLDKDFVHYSLPAFDDGLVPIIENGKQLEFKKLCKNVK
jgi:type I restriction enzyme S subunit